jgi:hypothetical protein
MTARSLASVLIPAYHERHFAAACASALAATSLSKTR